MKDKDYTYQVGDKIHLHSHGDLRRSMLVLSSVGYGVAVLGYADMKDHVLTIMALPERKSNE